MTKKLIDKVILFGICSLCNKEKDLPVAFGHPDGFLSNAFGMCQECVDKELSLSGGIEALKKEVEERGYLWISWD